MMNKSSLSKKTLVAFGLLLLVLYFLDIQQRSGTVIRLHTDQIEIQQFNNAIAKFLMVEGYGYEVEMVESTIKEVHEQLLRGDIDITLEFWKENNLIWYNQSIAGGSIDDLGILYNGGKQYWIVSKWYAEQKNIRTVLEMQQHWQDFVDPEDPSKGLFFNCIVGWPCRDINIVKLKSYGLYRYFNTVSPVSPESLKAIYENALTRKLPLFGYYWEPNAIMTKQDWYILEEPAYSEVVWQQLIKAASEPEAEPPQQACAYNDSGVHKIINSGLAKKAPDVVEMLRKMEMDYTLFDTILFNNAHLSVGSGRFRELARYFFLNYREHWTIWIPTDVRERVDQALQRSVQTLPKENRG